MALTLHGAGRCLAIIALSAWPAGCNVLAPDPWDQRSAALERSRERWAVEEIRSYRYTFSKSCECIPGFVGPVHITVRDDVVTSMEPVAGSDSVPADLWSAFDTVGEMFALIRTAIDDEAHQFEAEYDPELGYPTRISLDFDQQMVDDELVIRVEGLVIVSN